MLVMVAFVSQKGGVGKSTLARALATSAVAAGTDVRVADLDVQQATVTRWAERRRDAHSGPAIAVEAWATAADALAAADSDNQLLIVDAPPRASRGTLDIALRADLVVQPSGPGIDDLDPAILLFHELSRAGIADAKLVIALTRVASRREEDLARKYVEKAGYTVLPGSLLERPAYREAHNRGLSLAEVPDLDQRSQDLLRGLLAMIVDRVKVRMHGVDRERKRTGRKA